MQQEQFSKIMESFYHSNEQLEEALNIIGRLSKSQEKNQIASSALLNVLQNQMDCEQGDISDLLKEFIDNSEYKMEILLNSVSDMRQDISKLKLELEAINKRMDTFQMQNEKTLKSIKSAARIMIEESMDINDFDSKEG